MSDRDLRLKATRHRRLTEEEIDLWRQVANTIDRRPGSILPEPAVSPPPTAAAPKSERPPPRRVTAEPYFPPRSAPNKPQAAPLAPLERRLRQRLLRGRTSVDDVLDLHGLRQDEAHRSLRFFLHSAHSRGARLVLVVTGKGRASLHKEPHERETGVLRRSVPHWLRMPDMLPLIVGFEEAGDAHGGSGALYIRLRRAERLS